MKLKDKSKEYCEGCNDYVSKLEDINGIPLCDDCNNSYEDKTGYCSLNCCINGSCDESC